jgi:hypothetical protein
MFAQPAPACRGEYVGRRIRVKPFERFCLEPASGFGKRKELCWGWGSASDRKFFSVARGARCLSPAKV